MIANPLHSLAVKMFFCSSSCYFVWNINQHQQLYTDCPILFNCTKQQGHNYQTKVSNTSACIINLSVVNTTGLFKPGIFITIK